MMEKTALPKYSPSLVYGSLFIDRANCKTKYQIATSHIFVVRKSQPKRYRETATIDKDTGKYKIR